MGYIFKMKQELKTLKDIESWVLGYPRNDEKGVISLDLKKEAIKWVKEETIIGFTRYEADKLKSWIKHFFNLTEEDLKEKN